MRVLMVNRVNALSHFGGDTVQMLKTKEALEKRGLHVDVSVDLQAPVWEYDIVHAFNLVRVHETYEFVRRARQYNVPVALSTIYWNFDELETRGQSPLRSLLLRVAGRDLTERLKTAWRFLIRGERNRSTFRQLIYGYTRQQRYVLEASSCWLPNSLAEGNLVCSDFGISEKSVFVVPNAVDPGFASGNANRFYERYGLRDFVLCAGRFDPRKNLVSLIKAMNGVDVPLVLIGYPASNYQSYFEQMKRAATRTVHFLSPMVAADLADAYAAAKVHVQPSWAETPGLSSLEAGVAGCNIVITNRGSTREYFGDHAWYCDPADMASIRHSVESALLANRRLELRDYLLAHYTWDKAAEVTLQAYEHVLAR